MIDEIYKNVHKDAKDASFVAETHTITPAENGIDFNLDDAKNILKRVCNSIKSFISQSYKQNDWWRSFS